MRRLAGRLRGPLDEAEARLASIRSSPAGDVAVRVAGWAAAVVAFVVVTRWAFDVRSDTYFNGAVVGATIYGLVGIGIVLIYRTNRIINFAAAGLGATPGITMSLLVAIHGWSWWLAFVLAIVGGAVVGAIVDVTIIRRFADAPRLILTVATIGIAQIFAYASLRIGIALGTKGKPPKLTSPFTDKQFRVSGSIFTGDYPMALVVVVVTVASLTVFLRYTRIGIAMRASAENADRASLLGIPVRMVQTATWVIAGALAATCIFLRSTFVGVPADGSLGYKVFLFGLAAAVLGKMESIPRTMIAAIAIGIVGSATLSKTGKDSLTAALMLAVLLVALTLQRKSLSRAYDAGVSTWQAAREFRAIPSELRLLPEVVAAKVVLAILVVGALLAYPYVPFIGIERIGFAQAVVISAIVAVSIVILTGWAGQISLGQSGLVGVGAVMAGKLVTTWQVDFFVAVFAAAMAGAVVAVLIGVPALRIQGLFLAVTTLSFAGAVQFFFLDRSYRIPQLLLPDREDQVRTPLLWGRIALNDEFGPAYGFYVLCLVFLAGTMLMARAYRRNRAGRAVLAVRENTRAASAYSVNVARTRLGAFAVSGAIAGIAGALTVHQSGAVDASQYGIERGIAIFVIVVIGGLTSLPGAVAGAFVLESIRFFGSEEVQLLVTGPGLLLVLLVMPGGFAEAMHRVRDVALRWVARRRDIDVPSLTADRRQLGGREDGVIEGAEERVDQADAFDVLQERRVTCPVCGESMPVDEAPEHEHLRPAAPVGTAP